MTQVGICKLVITHADKLTEEDLNGIEGWLEGVVGELKDAETPGTE